MKRMFTLVRKNAKIVFVIAVIIFTNTCKASISDALDTALIFDTGGDAGWIELFSIIDYNGDYGDAVRSGYIYHNQESWMQTTVTGPGTVSFYWKVSSEGSYDFLEFYVDNQLQSRISGSVDWQQISHTVPSGSRNLIWRYIKDESHNTGYDCGWVDNVEWIPEGESPTPPPPSESLPDALDTTLVFGTGGDIAWFYQTLTSYYNGDAAQSGGINNNQESWMETTVTGPGALSFYWKVSSEGNYDFLDFYIDGDRQNRISGSIDWQQMNYTISSGSHHLEWRYTKDSSVSSGSDCGWVDKVEWIPGGEPPTPPPPSQSLPDALDTTLHLSTGGSSNWFYQTLTSYYDGDAAQSGSINNYQNSWMQTTVTGPGTLSFYWKVSSEANYDFLEFYIDGYLQTHISGSEDWQQKSYTIISGSHTLVWRYTKDGSESSGYDCGWVDKVEWTPEDEPTPPPPTPPESLSDALDTTLDVDTGGDADWFNQNVTFYYDEDAAQSGDISNNQESWIQTTVTGPGTLRFYWMVSSEGNYDFLEFYIDGYRQNRISGSEDWQQKSFAITSGSHTLVWRYIKDGSMSSSNDCGWVDKIEWTTGDEPTPPPPSPDVLSEALDTTLIFSTGGNTDWFNQNEMFYYNDDAAQSGHISHYQSSWMQTTVTGPGTLSFYWYVSSEANFDFLEFYIDSSRQNRISGSVGADWQQMSYTILSGPHNLVWRYIKDGSENAGYDCGWVDKVEWTESEPPTPTPPPPSDDLLDALDTTLDIVTGGNADWFNQNVTSRYDEDSAQSGDISDNQESWMQTTVTGPGTLRFYWKVSSEDNYDFLEFYINGYRHNRISGSVDWEQKSYALASGSNTLVWRYVKDSSMSSSEDCGWVDRLVWIPGEEPPTPPPPLESLSEALDTTLDFSTGGNADWFNQNSSFFYDGDAAQSGRIYDNQESWMQTTVTGPGTLSFYWYIISEFNFDFLEFYIDGIRQNRISGSVGYNWQQKSYDISSGPHTVIWRYFKDDSTSYGGDAGWVDKVEWVESEPPTPPPPAPSDSLSDAVETTLDLLTGGDADWFNQIETFYNDGDAAQSGDISNNQESWMQTTVTGPGALSFYWKVSSESNYDFLEFYVDGTRQHYISGISDWQQKSYAITSDMHTLVWRYIKDSSMSAGHDCSWVDKVEWVAGGEPPTPTPPSPSAALSNALDTTLAVFTGGDADWFNQNSIFYYGGDAAQSGHILHDQESWMQTTVTGPGTLRFYWRVSSEPNYDFLEFYIDDSRQNLISGSAGSDWQQLSYAIPSGSHTLIWRYVKDSSINIGSDCGWVDWVRMSP
jgi:hypothetical protein